MNYRQASFWLDTLKVREEKKVNSANNELRITNYEEKVQEKEILIFSPSFAI